MLEMPPVPAFIATLGTQSIAAGLALTISGGKSVMGFSIPLLIFMQTKVLMVIPTGFIIMLVCFALALFFLRRVKMGRYLYTIGDDAETAKLSGINVEKVKIGVYTLSGAMSAICGILCVSRFGTATTTTGDGVEMTAISATVIGGASLDGGAGSVLGAVLGIILLNIVDNGLVLLHVSVYGQDLVSGLILLIAVTMDVFSNHKKAK